MSWKRYALLGVLSLVLLVLTAAFQSAPGYMDADYYYAGGLQLAQGRGFTEPYLWNYLDNPAGLPHPSHAYWMPLASLLVAAGQALARSGSWTAGRVGFLLAGAAVAPVTAALAWELTHQRELAFISGLLGVVAGFYLPFLPVTDTFGLYMVFGGIFFLLLLQLGKPVKKGFFPVIPILLGITAGLMHLTRTDGVLWILLALAGVLFIRSSESPQSARLLGFLSTLVGYLLVMLPWFLRNQAVFGSFLGPGSSKMLWLTDYDQLFIYPAGRLSFDAWRQAGLASIVKARGWAVGINLQRTLAEQGEIFLLPLILMGAWHLRRKQEIQLAGLAWLLTFGVMTFLFPFAGARGGFFHSGAALQPVWWAFAPIGLDRAIEWGRQKRGWDARQAGSIFRPALVALAGLLTVAVLWGRLGGTSAEQGSLGMAPHLSAGLVSGKAGETWSQENYVYGQIYQFLLSKGISPTDVVMAANPPGFYLASSLSSIAVPDGNVPTLLEVAQRYGARYLILEEASMPALLGELYDQADSQSEVTYLGEMDQVRIFLFPRP